MRTWITTAVLAAAVLGVSACAADMQMGEVIDRVHSAAATKLGRQKAQVDIDQSLVTQGMNELDVFEVVRVLEKEFEISLPEEQWLVADWDMLKSMSVRRLAEIVAAQLQHER